MKHRTQPIAGSAARMVQVKLGARYHNVGTVERSGGEWYWRAFKGAAGFRDTKTEAVDALLKYAPTEPPKPPLKLPKGERDLALLREMYSAGRPKVADAFLTERGSRQALGKRLARLMDAGFVRLAGKEGDRLLYGLTDEARVMFARLDW